MHLPDFLSIFIVEGGGGGGGRGRGGGRGGGGGGEEEREEGDSLSSGGFWNRLNICRCCEVREVLL